MASGKTNYLENIALDHILRNQAFTPPATVYVALYTVAPGEAGGGTEVTGGSYARQAVAWAAASGGSMANSAIVTFPTATAGWGTIQGVALCDALAAGNLMYYQDGLSQLVNSGDVVSIAIGALTATET